MQKSFPRGHSGSFEDVPRWLFLSILVFAPWAYGCTPPWAVELLEVTMTTVLGLWLVAAAGSRRPVSVDPICLTCVSLVLLQGWWVTLNAHFEHIPVSHSFVASRPLASWMPGTVDQKTSAAHMIRITVLMGVVCFASDLAQRSAWRTRIWWTMALAGTSIALLGLIQRATDAPGIFWRAYASSPTFFGTYAYHGNAGAFLNLITPLVAGRAILAIADPSAHGGRALWGACSLLCASATFVNVSRAGAAISVLLLLALAFRHRGLLFSMQQRPRRSVAAIYVSTIVVFVAVIIALADWEAPAQKWAKLHQHLNAENPRLLAWGACWQMIKDAGPWGLGPGTFAITFPHYTGLLGDRIAGTWRFAHQDYLQTLAEWGWIGSMAPALLFFGGLYRCFDRVRVAATFDSQQDRVLLSCAGLALAGIAMHALIDFPLQIASLQVYVATLLGLGWAKCRTR